VHFHGVSPTVVVKRDELWGRIEPLLRSDSSSPTHASAAVWRFRDADGRKLIAVEESC
jgi:hypothetical protein